MGSPRRGDLLIYHLVIEGVNESITPGYRAIRPFVDADRAQPLLPPGQGFALGLCLDDICPEASRHRCGRKFHPRHTGRCQDSLLLDAQPFELLGVGRQWAAWLAGQAIHTALDLKHADAKAIRREMTVVGERLVYELNGRSCPPLELVAPPRKGLTVSRSFGQTLTRLQPIKEALLQFVGRAAEKLRRQRLMTSHLMVFVMTNRFSTTRPFYSQSATVMVSFN